MFRALEAIVNRIPWASDVQHAEVLAHLRDGESELKPDHAPVVSPAPVIPEPATAAAAVAAGAGVDYDKLAAAIVKAQAAQQAQAAAALAADPGFEPPGSVNAPPAETHAAADTLGG